MLVVLINYDLDSCYWRLSLTPTKAQHSFCAKREKGAGGCVSLLEAHTQQSEADLAAFCSGRGAESAVNHQQRCAQASNNKRHINNI